MIFAHVAASTGWTLDAVGAMTISDLDDMEAYWRRHPPVHLLVAGYLGIGGEEDDEAWDDAALTSADLAELKARYERDNHGDG